MIKKFFFSKTFLVCTSILLVILVLEISLRIVGLKPYETFKKDLEEPTINKYDSKIGWIPKEGIYIFPPTSINGKNTNFTILKNGNRFSGKEHQDSKGDIVFIGGSFTQGFSVNDEETFSYLLQEKIPNFTIKNYGVGGYGTYQSYLLLKEIIKKNNNIKKIVYFYIYYHEDRNIGDFTWVKFLTKFSSRGHAHFPYVTLDRNDNLIENPPIKYIELPFRKFSILVTKTEEVIMKIKLYSKNKYKNKSKITQKTILKMKELSEKNNINFVLVNLLIKKNTYNSYIEFFKKNNIEGAYCTFPLIKGFIVENDGHPNDKMHKLYADCIYDFVFN